MDEGTTSVTVSVIFTAISGFVLVLRSISRFIIIRKGGVDDVFAILAWLSTVAVAYAIYGQSKHGLGVDIQDVKPADLTMLLKFLWASIIPYNLGLTSVKVSALLQYLRFLFERPYRITCWSLIAFCSSCGTASILICLFGCQPRGYWWDKTIAGGKCINIMAWWYFAASWIIATDIIVVMIPIVAIKNLTMPKAQKRSLIVVFALGGFGCAASILRVHSLSAAGSFANITRDNAAAAMWSCMEMNIGIICISLPPLKALFCAMFPSLMKTATTSDGLQRLPSRFEDTQLQSTWSQESQRTLIPQFEFDPSNKV